MWGFTNHKSGKKIFMIDGCDWIASKVALWRLLKREFGKYAHYVMPETFVLSSEEDKKKFKKFYDMKKAENKGSKFILKNYKQRQEGFLRGTNTLGRRSPSRKLPFLR